jgi:hypothetical protein
MNVDGPSCSNCKPGMFHLSSDNKDGCLSCFCMGVTQQCFSSTYYRDLVSSVFSPGNFQGYALVNRQRTNRISTGFTVEVSTEGTQLSYSNFDYLGQEPHYWQLPGAYQGDKDPFNARMKRAEQSDSYMPEEELRKDASIWNLMASERKGISRSKRARQDDVRQLDDEVWAILSNASRGHGGSPPFFPHSPPSSSSRRSGAAASSSSSSRLPDSKISAPSTWSIRNLSPPSPPSGIPSSVRPGRPQPSSPGHAPRLQSQQSKNIVSKTSPGASGASSKYALVYKGFSLHPDDLLYWRLPAQFTGDKVTMATNGVPAPLPPSLTSGLTRGRSRQYP